jgi:hypothetical protein
MAAQRWTNTGVAFGEIDLMFVVAKARERQAKSQQSESGHCDNDDDNDEPTIPPGMK